METLETRARADYPSVEDPGESSVTVSIPSCVVTDENLYADPFKQMSIFLNVFQLVHSLKYML